MPQLLDETPEAYTVQMDDGKTLTTAKGLLSPEADQNIRNLPRATTGRPNTNFVGSAMDAIFRPDPPEVVANREAQARAGGLMPPETPPETVGEFAGRVNRGLMGALGDEKSAQLLAQQEMQKPPPVTDADLQKYLTPEQGSHNDPGEFVTPSSPTDALAKDTDKFLVDSTNRYKAAAKEMYGAQAGREADLERVYAGEMIRQKASIETAQREEERRQRVMADSMSQVTKAVDDFKAIPEVDPDRIFGKGITAKKVTSTIALALGAFGASYNGGHNYAMNMLQTQIANDIDAQKANINKSQAGVRNQMGLYDMNRQQFADEHQATAATEAMYYNYAKTETQKIVAGSNSKVAQAQGKMFIAELDAKEAAAKQKFVERAQFNQSVTYGNAANIADQIDRRAEIYAEGDKVGIRKLKANAFGDYEKLRTVAKNRGEILEALKELRGLSVVARSNPLSKEYTKIKNFGVLISGVVSQMQKGPMSDQDAARILEPLLPKLTTYINKGQFDELESGISRALESQEKSLTGALQQLRLDPEAIKKGLQDPNAGYFKKQEKK